MRRAVPPNPDSAVGAGELHLQPPGAFPGGHDPASRGCSAGPTCQAIRSNGTLEGVLTGECLTQDQRVYVVGSLVGVDRFQIGHVPHGVVFDEDSVSTQQASSLPRDVGRHVAVGTLRKRDLLRSARLRGRGLRGGTPRLPVRRQLSV